MVRRGLCRESAAARGRRGRAGSLGLRPMSALAEATWRRRPPVCSRGDDAEQTLLVLEYRKLRSGLRLDARTEDRSDVTQPRSRAGSRPGDVTSAAGQQRLLRGSEDVVPWEAFCSRRSGRPRALADAQVLTRSQRRAQEGIFVRADRTGSAARKTSGSLSRGGGGSYPTCRHPPLPPGLTTPPSVSGLFRPS